eukprot:1835881-Pyramimonas_sp.AAC.1
MSPTAVVQAEHSTAPSPESEASTAMTPGAQAPLRSAHASGGSERVQASSRRIDGKSRTRRD